MKHDYQAMLAALEPDEVPTKGETANELLYQIVQALPAKTIDHIASRLESDRHQLSFSSSPGHLVWYPRKVAVCALWQRLTRPLF